MYEPGELQFIKDHVALSKDGSCLVWTTRRPDQFEGEDPVRIARGWNLKWPGRPCGLNRNGQVCIRGRYFTANKVIRVLGGHKGGSSRPMRFTATGDLDAAMIRRLFEVDSEGYVVWSLRTMSILGDLQILAEQIAEDRSRARGTFTAKSVKTFNSVHAGRRVSPGAGGFVYVAGGLRVRLEEICNVFRIPVKIPEKNDRQPLQPVSEQLIRLMFRIGEHGVFYYRERTLESWKKLHAEGGTSVKPSAAAVSEWNWRYAGKPVKVATNDTVSLGRRAVTAGRIYDVLKVQNVGKTTNVDTNPYSF